jgi:hypothetical protein
LSDQALLEKVDKNIDKFQVTIQQKKCIWCYFLLDKGFCEKFDFLVLF